MLQRKHEATCTCCKYLHLNHTHSPRDRFHIFSFIFPLLRYNLYSFVHGIDYKHDTPERILMHLNSGAFYTLSSNFRKWDTIWNTLYSIYSDGNYIEKTTQWLYYPRPVLYLDIP